MQSLQRLHACINKLSLARFVKRFCNGYMSQDIDGLKYVTCLEIRRLKPRAINNLNRVPMLATFGSFFLCVGVCECHCSHVDSGYDCIYMHTLDSVTSKGQSVGNCYAFDGGRHEYMGTLFVCCSFF